MSVRNGTSPVSPVCRRMSSVTRSASPNAYSDVAAADLPSSGGSDCSMETMPSHHGHHGIDLDASGCRDVNGVRYRRIHVRPAVGLDYADIMYPLDTTSRTNELLLHDALRRIWPNAKFEMWNFSGYLSDVASTIPSAPVMTSREGTVVAADRCSTMPSDVRDAVPSMDLTAASVEQLRKDVPVMGCNKLKERQPNSAIDGNELVSYEYAQLAANDIGVKIKLEASRAIDNAQIGSSTELMSVFPTSSTQIDSELESKVVLCDYELYNGREDILYQFSKT